MYDASTPPPENAKDALEAVRDVAAVDAEQRLQEKLDEIDDLLAQIEEYEEENPDEPIDEATIALLESISGAENAPLEFASIHRRVHSGALTWQQFWDNPGYEQGGLRLLGEVVTRQMAGRADLMAGPDAFFGGERPPVMNWDQFKEQIRQSSDDPDVVKERLAAIDNPEARARFETVQDHLRAEEEQRRWRK